MRFLIFALILGPASAMLGTCGSPGQRSSGSTAPAGAETSSSPDTRGSAPAPASSDGPPVAVAHSGAPGGTTPRATQNATDQAGTDTSALDARIAKAEIKAKASSATEADRRAAADAYLERANVYYSAGQPRLYKFALGDFRRVLRYEPENAEAREKMDMIVSIYQQMGRPVPENGNEP